MISAVLTVTIFSGCSGNKAASVPGTSASQFADTSEKPSGNINNGGFAAQQGDWIYYGQFSGGGPYKIKTDDTGKTKLSDVIPVYINVAEDWIYYTSFISGGILKIKTDGTEETELPYLANNINVVGDWIYSHIKRYGERLTGTGNRECRKIQ